MSIRRADMLERERVANQRKHWVRTVTACNSRCLFCLDSDTPRNLFLDVEEVCRELRRGRDELQADKVILSGGEASLHPRFLDFIRYSKSLGYSRVQTVTNGWMFAEKDFYRECVAAGLGEITFSLHGHTAELHDHLTQSPESFNRILKGIIRTVRDQRVICNVDVVINKGNVAVLDKIVELCIGVGVTEFDLLHVIPQAAAFENREQLFYDPADHLEVLHKVFRLNRHPGFVIWTNRFPVPFLEGLEDLIQDPHKMLDEVNGRRFAVRRYLDAGQPLDCRQPERCVHCFIEPFCTSTDRFLARSRAETWEVWWTGEPDAEGEPAPLPLGTTRRGVATSTMGQLPTSGALYAEVERAEHPPPDRDLILVATRADHLEAWLGVTPLEIRLNQATAPWLLDHRDRLAAQLGSVRLHQASHERLEQAADDDVRDPAGFFGALALPVPVSGLPACLAPGATLAEPIRRLDKDLFDTETGRPSIAALARHHIVDGYHVKSLRCRTCRVRERCDGIHVNMVRDQGLALATPLVEGPWADEADRQLRALRPDPTPRVGQGRPREAVIPSLPGFPGPAVAPSEPLAVLAKSRKEARAARRLEILGNRDG